MTTAGRARSDGLRGSRGFSGVLGVGRFNVVEDLLEYHSWRVSVGFQGVSQGCGV